MVRAPGLAISGRRENSCGESSWREITHRYISSCHRRGIASPGTRRERGKLPTGQSRRKPSRPGKDRVRRWLGFVWQRGAARLVAIESANEAHCWEPPARGHSHVHQSLPERRPGVRWRSEPCCRMMASVAGGSLFLSLFLSTSPTRIRPASSVRQGKRRRWTQAKNHGPSSPICLEGSAAFRVRSPPASG